MFVVVGCSCEVFPVMVSCLYGLAVELGGENGWMGLRVESYCLGY
jgi:hypothetical protein